MGEKMKKILIPIVAIILIAVLGIVGAVSKKNEKFYNSLSKENRKAITYAEVEEGEQVVEDTSGNVSFDAFFLRDLDGDGYAVARPVSEFSKIGDTCT